MYNNLSISLSIYIYIWYDIGALINLQNHNGSTALHIAAANGYTTTVRFLLRIGASKKMKNKEALTAGQVATAAGYHTTAQCILEFFTPIRSPHNLLQFLEDKLPKHNKEENDDGNSNNNILNNLQDTLNLGKLRFTHMMNSFSSSILEPLGDLLKIKY